MNFDKGTVDMLKKNVSSLVGNTSFTTKLWPKSSFHTAYSKKSFRYYSRPIDLLLVMPASKQLVPFIRKNRRQ